jgi:hypothetical protein
MNLDGYFARIGWSGACAADSGTLAAIMSWAGVTVRAADITGRALEVAIPLSGGSAAQLAALQSAVQYGQTVGVTVRIIPF